eukprot:357104-Chlamydomonas_euryale.AAC.4
MARGSASALVAATTYAPERSMADVIGLQAERFQDRLHETNKAWRTVPLLYRRDKRLARAQRIWRCAAAGRAGSTGRSIEPMSESHKRHARCWEWSNACWEWSNACRDAQGGGPTREKYLEGEWQNRHVTYAHTHAHTRARTHAHTHERTQYMHEGS